MADDAGPPRPDLNAPPAEALPAEAMDFFELLRRLEREGGRFGAGGRPGDEPARLGQNVRLAFATQDIAEWRPGKDGAPAEVRVANFGLLGPEGPMPLHLTRWVFDRLSQRWFSDHAADATHDTTFLDFANLLQHRMIGLFYRAWADFRPAAQVERPGGGRVAALLGALAGVGLPEAAPSAAVEALARRHATALGHQVEGPERLTRMLADALDARVELSEFVGVWMPIPERLRSRLGGPLAQLGGGATVGARTFQRQARIEIALGPLGLDEFAGLLPGAAALGQLREIVRHVIGETLDVDLRLVLAGAEVPAARLGSARLGRVAWLPRRGAAEDRGDLRLRGFVGFGLETAA